MRRQQLLKEITFGARVAEDETGELAKYFVETDQWSRIFKGEIDIIRGEKGSGKSAIYSLLERISFILEHIHREQNRLRTLLR